MGIAGLLQLLLPILTTGLGSIIPGNLQALVNASAAAIASLVAELLGGKQTASSVSLASLQALQTEINSLKTANILLTLNQANEINALDAGITDAITAYEASLATTDPSNLTPLPTAL